MASSKQAREETTLSYFILGILPYITFAVFLAGMAYRFRVWMRAPQPVSITLFPAPQGRPATFLGVLKGAFLFPGLFKGDRILWIFAWIFHAVLGLVILGHARVVTDFPRLWAALGIDADRMSTVLGGAAGVVLMIFTILLFVRRLTVARVREVSTSPDYFALFLVAAVVLSGNIMRFGEHFDLEVTRTYFSRLATFSLDPSTVPANAALTVHFLLGQLLIMVIPFSKIMHFGGIFFTQTVIQRA